jgi:hypothetical protein
MHDVGFTQRTTSLAAMPAEMRTVLHTGLEFGWRARPVRLLLLVSLVQGTFTMWSWSAWQPYLLGLLGRDAVWVAGLIAALIALATTAGNALVDVLTRFCGRRTTLLLAAMAMLAATAVGVGLAGSFWVAVALLLAVSAAEGIAVPVQQAYLHQVIPSAQRATVVSAVSLVSSAGGIGGQLGLGWIARAQSLAAGYVVGGLAMLLALPPLLGLRHRCERADVIVGRRAGTKGACAAQGLPVVASLDSLPRQPTPAATGLRIPPSIPSSDDAWPATICDSTPVGRRRGSGPEPGQPAGRPARDLAPPGEHEAGSADDGSLPPAHPPRPPCPTELGRRGRPRPAPPPRRGRAGPGRPGRPRTTPPVGSGSVGSGHATAAPSGRVAGGLDTAWSRSRRSRRGRSPGGCSYSVQAVVGSGQVVLAQGWRAAKTSRAT